MNHKVRNCVRTLLCHSKLPKELWGELLLSSVYLINRTPCGSEWAKSPLECITGKRPSIKHLIPIGEKLFYKSLSSNKLDARGKSEIMVGYEENRNAYRIWKPDTNLTIISRDLMRAAAAAKGETTSKALMTTPIGFLRAAVIANLLDYEKWHVAMVQEHESLMQHKVWVEVDRPNCKVLRTR
jgi:hypothetical protein